MYGFYQDFLTIKNQAPALILAVTVGIIAYFGEADLFIHRLKKGWFRLKRRKLAVIVIWRQSCKSLAGLLQLEKSINQNYGQLFGGTISSGYLLKWNLLTNFIFAKVVKNH
jgi:hypothetical protein